MATMYTYDATTGTYVLSDTGTFVFDAAGAYVQSLSVSTDLADYAPGSTATFTANVDVGDTVTFNVTDVAGTAVSGTSHPWTITDGGAGDLDGVANGVIQTSWAVGLDAANQAFVLSASDLTNGLTATTSFTDTPPVTVFPPVDAVAPDGANGMLITTAGALSTGTGIFPAFVQLQGQNANSTTEEGYNPANPPVDDTGASATFNHPIQVKDIPTETIGDVTYFVFRLDLNEPNDGSAGLATLDSLKLFYDATGNALATADGSPTGATPLYDMDGGVNRDISIVLADWSSGSGHGDYVFKIPVNVTLDPNAFIYLFSSFSNAEGGFEEWAMGPPSNGTVTPDASISGTKWVDADGDLTSTGDETVASGWTIYIDANNNGNLDSGELSTSTDVNGSYTFTGLAAGTYVVREVLKPGWIQLGTDPLNATVTLTDHGAGSVDFFNFEKFTIQGHKYLDANDNHQVDSGEIGLSGVTINLYDWIDANLDGVVQSSELTTPLQSTVTDNNGAWSFANLTPLTAGEYFVQETVPGGFTETVGNSGYIVAATSGNDTTVNFANAVLEGGVHGLTQGFWATHSAAWDDTLTKGETATNLAWGNLVDKPDGLWGDFYTSSEIHVIQTGSKYAGDDDIIYALGQAGPVAKGSVDPHGVLLGDANGDGQQDGYEGTKLFTITDAQKALAASSLGDAKTIMLNQLIAAQLNVYNGDKDPGSYVDPSLPPPTPGHDLVGEGVLWLNGQFSGAPGTTSAASWTSHTPGVAFDTHEQWTMNVGTHHIGDEIYASGQDLKNVLQAFNQNQIGTSADDHWVGWNNGGVLVGVHENTADAFWLVAAEHGLLA
jgi:hypothetical protein